MVRFGDNFMPTGEMLYEKGAGVTLPNFGGLAGIIDLSIHSHPTAILDENGRYVAADEPSPDLPGNPGDESAFKNFEINIIVGNNGDLIERKDPVTGHPIFDESGRYPAINIYSSNYKDDIGKISGGKKGEADKMIKGDRGRLGRKFDKKSNKGN
jgi:hypothetical protein